MSVVYYFVQFGSNIFFKKHHQQPGRDPIYARTNEKQKKQADAIMSAAMFKTV